MNLLGLKQQIKDLANEQRVELENYFVWQYEVAEGRKYPTKPRVSGTKAKQCISQFEDDVLACLSEAQKQIQEATKIFCLHPKEDPCSYYKKGKLCSLENTSICAFRRYLAEISGEFKCPHCGSFVLEWILQQNTEVLECQKCGAII